MHLSFLSNIFIKTGARHVLSRLSFVTIRVVVEDQLDQGQFLAATENHPSFFQGKEEIESGIFGIFGMIFSGCLGYLGYLG